MRKKRRTINKKKKEQIVIEHWLAYKPYRTHGRYDNFYTSCANEVLEILKDYTAFWTEEEVDFDNQKTIAVLLTSRFEDFISEIGLWQAFIQHNQGTFGYYLPFYDMANYDADYLNPADFSYQIWHQLNFDTEEFYLAPDKEEIIEMGQHIYQLLEAKIDIAPVTDFYQQYFTLTDDIGLAGIKSALVFLCESSYLLGGGHFAPILQEELEEQMKNFATHPMMGAMSFALVQNEYLYNHASCWGGLSAREWLLAVCTASKETKKKVANLYQNVTSTFIFLGKDDKYYYYQHRVTKAKFNVLKMSFNLPKEAEHMQYHLHTLVKWGDDWLMSGASLPIPNDGIDAIEEAFAATKPNFFAYPQEVQQKNIAYVQKMEADLQTYMGGEYKYFDQQADFDQFMDEFVKLRQKQEGIESSDSEESKGNMALPFNDDVMIALTGGQGYLIFNGFNRAKTLSELAYPEPYEQEELMDFFLNEESHPINIQVFSSELSLKNIPNLFVDSNFEMGRNILYLNAFYNYDNYDTLEPMMVIGI